MATINCTAAQMQAIFSTLGGVVVYSVDGLGNVVRILLRQEPHHTFALTTAITEAQLLVFLGEYKSLKVDSIT